MIRQTTVGETIVAQGPRTLLVVSGLGECRTYIQVLQDTHHSANSKGMTFSEDCVRTTAGAMETQQRYNSTAEYVW